MASGVTVRAVVLSRFALDGGAMHGIVPRTLWERIHRPDEKNRIALVARAILVEHAGSGARTLVELGMGQRWTAKERAIYGLEEGGDAPDELATAGIDPATITHVVLTHLHWDHAGGIALRSGALAFPRAEHVVGAASLAYARAPTPKDAGSFREDDIALLTSAPRLRLFEGEGSLAPGLELHRATRGHTEGLLIPWIPERDDGPPLAMPTDLVPTRSHLKLNWGMAYDNDPRAIVEEKRALFEDLLRVGGGIALYHDASVEAAWATRAGDAIELAPGALDGARAS